MSVNMKRIRDLIGDHGPLPRGPALEMCDEIDRLLSTLDLERRSMNRSADIIKELQTEVSILREQLRPRSIKDEPPVHGSILAHAGDDDGWYAIKYRNPESLTSWKWWIPQLPAPPQPDAFLEWAEAQPWWQEFGDLSRAYVRDTWNAAIQSTKGKV